MTAVNERDIQALIEMGFPRGPVVEALTALNGNVDAAAELLLRGGEELIAEQQAPSKSPSQTTQQQQSQHPPPPTHSAPAPPQIQKKTSSTQKLIRTSSSTGSSLSTSGSKLSSNQEAQISQTQQNPPQTTPTTPMTQAPEPPKKRVNMDDEELADSGDEQFVMVDEGEDGDDALLTAAAAAVEDDESWFDDSGAIEEKQFRVLERKQLEQMLLSAIDQVASQLALEKDDAQNLLKLFSWKYEKLQNSYFDRPDYYLDQAGIKQSTTTTTTKSTSLRSSNKQPQKIIQDNKKSNSNLSGAKVECLVCLSDVPISDTFALHCGHSYCFRCWQQHLAVSVTERGQNVITTRCMYPNCQSKLGLSVWKRLSAPADYERYLYFLLKDFVERNGKYVFCVNPNCGRAIQFLGVGKPSVVVECTCGQRFCFSCGQDQHNPITCEMLSKWKERNSNDSESEKLVKAISKNCFHCGFPTERNNGCNHMTCSRCRGEWCWMCRGDWKTHGSHTGGFYSCNKYDTSEAKKLDDWSGRYLEDNKRFKHYFERFFNHDTAKKQLQRNAGAIIKTCQEYGNTMHTSYDAVAEAITLLCECRQVLKYTFVYGFYLKPESKEIPFFEFTQANAEGITERLASIVITPVEKMDLDNLKNMISVTKKYISNLSKAIEHGLTSEDI